MCRGTSLTVSTGRSRSQRRLGMGEARDISVIRGICISFEVCILITPKSSGVMKPHLHCLAVIITFLVIPPLTEARQRALIRSNRAAPLR